MKTTKWWLARNWEQHQKDILRAPPPCDRYVSDCLQEFKAGDHLEIQWKSRTEIPYGRFLAIASLHCQILSWGL
ncbi:hypothetical protein CR513_46932, partial [Mucuna pruriens]